MTATNPNPYTGLVFDGLTVYSTDEERVGKITNIEPDGERFDVIWLNGHGSTVATERFARWSIMTGGRYDTLYLDRTERLS
jgi:histidyl-tRNA synthetase